MDRTKQQQTVAINRGLFLVRYAAAEDKARPPKIMISSEPASNGNIDLLLHPDHDAAVLWQPDSCLVVRAMAAGKLSVQVIPVQEGGSAAATVRIEPIGQGDVPSPIAQTINRSIESHDLGNLRILGHLSRTGDVWVNANEWLAGPSAPLRIEGISIDWPGKPADLDLYYAVKTAKPQTTSGQKMSLGSFAGTRGKAMPIVGLMLEISGPAAAKSQICLEAIFLGSPAMLLTGKRVVASGPTGQEPLVGLRIGLESVRAPATSRAKTSTRKLERSTGRVRVFRSHQNHNQPATI